MRILCAAVLLVVGLAAAGAQTTPASAGQNATTLTLPALPLLLAHPADLTLGASESGAAPAGAGCGLLADAPAGLDCPALLKEDGLTRWQRGSYTRAGAAAVPAAAWEFGDATGAYSAYTFLRTELRGAHVTDGDARTGKAHETSAGEAGTLAWAGTTVLWLGGRTTAQELAAAVAALPKVGGRAGLSPLLPTLEPADGRDRGSERYALGPVGYRAEGGALPADVLGWNKSAEVLTGSYGRGTVTLMLYPTPQIAGDRGRAVEAALNAGGAAAGSIRMRRLGPLVGLAMGLAPERAKDLLDSLRLNQEISFDKPMPLEFHAEIRKTYTLMQSIALFCGLGLVACVLLALFLGGARAGIRVLQGKPAATEPEFLTINLRNEARGVLLDHRADGSDVR